MLKLFFPHLCCGCDRRLSDGSQVLCVNCQNELPICFPKNIKDNAFVRQFYGRLLIESAFTLLRFEKTNLTQRLLHQLKYKGQQQLGVFFGLRMGSMLRQLKPATHFDLIIPVPLSNKRKRKRGYNQVEKFAQSLGQQLNSPVNSKALIRRDSRHSLVKLGRSSRFKREHHFEVNHKLELSVNMHILLVDDIVTTGATLEACAKVLLNKGDFKLSFATIAISE
ncbi:ComF family protein [Gilvibacter sediminis]|uniref:ComF family protein n=1 Tax=Gilvibacter sediminis TaxID=379071 RepID=UPI00234FB6E6|nr:phosphoribosyltransferase family protein [Gilvibacter sediminis]MDC7997105.1 phosphoribosyltransferase family protein [Gilvibacter sediminis]